MKRKEFDGKKKLNIKKKFAKLQNKKKENDVNERMNFNDSKKALDSLFYGEDSNILVESWEQDEFFVIEKENDESPSYLPYITSSEIIIDLLKNGELKYPVDFALSETSLKTIEETQQISFQPIFPDEKDFITKHKSISDFINEKFLKNAKHAKNENTDKGFLIKIKNINSIVPTLGDLIKKIDGFWRGEGDIQMEGNLSSAGAKTTFPSHFKSQNSLIIQISGTQKFSIFNKTEDFDNDLINNENELSKAFLTWSNYPSTIIPFIPLSDNDNEIKISENGEENEEEEDDDGIVVLKEGDILFLPSNSAIVSRGVSNENYSFDITISLQNFNLEMMIDEAIMQSKFNLFSDNNNKKRIHPHFHATSSSSFSSFFEIQGNYSQMMKSFIVNFQSQIIPSISKYEKRFAYCNSHFELPKNYLIEKFGTIEKILSNTNITRVCDVFPLDLADRIANVISSISEEEWVITEASYDVKYNNIDHTFHSAKIFPYSNSIFNIFRNFLPTNELTISAGRYLKGHFIDPHDDKALKELHGVQYYRKYAVIYYLSKNWKGEYGGSLVDEVSKDKREFVPLFNSMVLFRVPHMHSVAPVITDDHARYSFFGWFLTREKLYDLDDN